MSIVESLGYIAGFVMGIYLLWKILEFFVGAIIYEGAKRKL